MSVLEAGIGWLAPPQCVICGAEGLALCGDCSTTEIMPFGARCWRCSRLSAGGQTCVACRHAGGPNFVWITTDYRLAAQRLVQIYKFGQLRAAGESLAGLMAQTLQNFHDPAEIQALDYLIVPVPTATSRVRQRGFDHSARLARLLARRLRLDSALALGRLGQQRQLGRGRAERLAQTAGNYYVRQPNRIKGRNILLIDDVITTGGTITETAKVLRTAGAGRIDALIFAKKL